MTECRHTFSTSNAVNTMSSQTTEDVFTRYIAKMEETLERSLKTLESKLEARDGQTIMLSGTIEKMRLEIDDYRSQLKTLQGEIHSMLERLQELGVAMVKTNDHRCEGLERRLTEAEFGANTQILEVHQKFEVLDEFLSKWINRGIGVWAIITLVAGLLYYQAERYAVRFTNDVGTLTEDVSQLKNWMKEKDFIISDILNAEYTNLGEGHDTNEPSQKAEPQSAKP